MSYCDRFHKAAKDGLLDVLKEASRKDANSKDDDSMTPVLWAAFEGRLDALRLLCGRGGDPDKCDQFGNTALHLASAKGHLHCVDFLVKFGVNIYALDIDKHSAKDLAAINNRDEILRYLDKVAANLEASDRKKAKAMRELAEKNSEKQMRQYAKRQEKQQSAYSDVKPIGGTHKSPSTNMLYTLKQKIWSSQGNLHKPNATKFSDLVKSGPSSNSSGSISSRTDTIQKKLKSGASNNESQQDTGFKIGETEPDGRRTITSLTGVQRDSEVLYVGTFSSNEEHGKRGKISDVFDVEEALSENENDTRKLGYGTLARSFSQPDILADSYSDKTLNTPEISLNTTAAGGLFERPMLGSIAFRRSVTAALSQLHPETDGASTATPNYANVPKTRTNKSRSFFDISDSDSDGGDGYSDEEQESSYSPIKRFLAVWGLEEYFTVFQKQQIDLDSLMLLTEADLKTLGLPLGPFRKLTFAIQERQNALANPGAMLDSRL